MKTQQQHNVVFWRSGARDAWETAQILFAKRRYAFALFFGHLALEKLLKALVAAGGEAPSYTHDLRVLATNTDLQLPATTKRQLDTISTFNVRARYDSVKHAFALRATRAYTAQWFVRMRTLYVWLEKQFQQR